MNKVQFVTLYCALLFHIKVIQIIEILLNIFRLSFYERMRDIVPVDFEPLLPEKPEPKFKYVMEKSCKVSIFIIILIINCKLYYPF